MTATTTPRSAARQGSSWRVAVVEDHLLQRRRTEELLGAQVGLSIVFSGETLPDLLAWLDETPARHRPHLVVLDLVVERGPSVEPAQVRRLGEAGIRVLVLSAMASPAQVKGVIRAGIAGVVGKRDSEKDVVTAVWAALGGRRWISPEVAAVIAGDAERPPLSDQEERALVLYASGLTLDAVAAELGVQPGTAKKYLTRVRQKYEAAGRPVRTKVAMSREAVRDGLL